MVVFGQERLPNGSPCVALTIGIVGSRRHDALAGRDGLVPEAVFFVDLRQLLQREKIVGVQLRDAFPDRRRFRTLAGAKVDAAEHAAEGRALFRAFRGVQRGPQEGNGVRVFAGFVIEPSQERVESRTRFAQIAGLGKGFNGLARLELTRQNAAPEHEALRRFRRALGGLQFPQPRVDALGEHVTLVNPVKGGLLQGVLLQHLLVALPNEPVPLLQHGAPRRLRLLCPKGESPQNHQCHQIPHTHVQRSSFM